MTVVTPFTGLLLGAIVIPLLLLLYFLRLRRQTMQISSTMLWERAVEDLHANSPFQRLRPSTLLVLQLLALALVVFAIMQPQIEGGTPNEGTHVILIDRSGSMTAIGEDDLSRLEEAKEKAIHLVDQIHGGGIFSSSGGETMVIAFSDHAEVVSPFTDSIQQLSNAILSIEPTHGQSLLRESLTLARAYTTTVDPEKDGLSASESAQLELFSDGRIADISEQALQRGESLQYHMVGSTDARNIGIATIDAQRKSESSEEVQVFLSLLNTNPESATADIELQIDGVPIGVQQVTIPAQQGDLPGTTSMVFVPFSISKSGVVSARILTEDALEIDNQASLIIPPAKELKVLLAEEGAPIIQTVLEGMHLAELSVVSGSTLNQMLTDGSTTSFDVVVARDVQLASVPRGAYLLFGQPPPIPAFDTHVDGEAQVMLVARDEHPVMRFVRYEEIVVTKGYDVVVDQSVDTLLEGSQWSAVMAYRGDGIQLIYVSFDPMNSNWPYLRSFPFFVFNGVHFLGHRGNQLTASSRQVGQTITEHVLESETIELIEPDGSIHSVLVDGNGEVSWGPIRLMGVHAIQSNKVTHSRIAINSPTSESNIASREQISIGATKVSASRSSGNSFIQLWPWALGAVLAVLLAEWWVYQKKVSTPLMSSWAQESFSRKSKT